MEKHSVQRWLDRYGDAWVDGDPDQIVVLFTEGASYRETPFEDPMIGHDKIRQYWQEGAADAQDNVEFSSQVWAIEGDKAVAGWQAKFTRKKDGTRVELDGAFRLKFAECADALRCDNLEEWWHRREV